MDSSLFSLLGVIRQNGKSLSAVKLAMQFNRGDLSFSNGLGGSIGLTIPLLLGVLLHHPADGAISSVGALLAGLVAFNGYHRTRLQALAWEAVLMSFMSFCGALLSGNTISFSVFAALCAAVAGMSLTLGPTFSMVVIEAVLQMAISSAFQLDFNQALVRALYVLLGVLLQLVIVMVSWLFAIGKQEFATVSRLLEILAEYCEAVTTEGQPPQPPIFFDYQSVLGDPNPFLRREKLSLIRSLASEAEQLRVNLVAFVNLTRPLCNDPILSDAVNSILVQAHNSLIRAAKSVFWEYKERGLAQEFSMGLDSFSGTLVILESLNTTDRLVVTALLRQLSHIGLEPRTEFPDDMGRLDQKPIREWRPSIRNDLSAAKEVILKNINLESDAFRHSIRLVVAAFISVLVTRETHISRGYWVFLTVIVVLKPDYATTIRRGVERTVGTILGVALAVAVVGGLHLSHYQLIPLIFVLAVGAYWVFRANYAIFVVLLTILVVALLEIAGLGVVVTAKARLADTLLGGFVAIGVYLIWPTWGKSNMYFKMAQLLDAQRVYATELIEVAIGRKGLGDEMNNLLIRARSTRIVAEGALERVSYEPKQQVLGYTKRAQFISSTRLFAGACLSLQAACKSGTTAINADETKVTLEEISRIIDGFYLKFIEELRGSMRHPRADLSLEHLEKLSNKVALDLGRGPRRGSLIALSLLEMTDAVRSIEELLSTIPTEG